MTGVSGFCLKCKTYGPIRDGKMIKMSNGRTRCAGFVLNLGAPVKFLKLSLKILPIRIYTESLWNNCEGSWSRVMTLP